MNSKKQLWEIGNRRVYKVAMSWNQPPYSYKTWINPWNHKGPDIIVIDEDGKVKRVVESTNYAKPTENISPTKLDHYIDTLNDYAQGIPDCEKEIIISYMTNISQEQLAKLRENGIIVTVVGHQD